MASNFTTELEFKVFNDGTGECVSVGMDGAGLDLVELQAVEQDNVRARITMEPLQAKLVADAIYDYLKAQHPDVPLT